jgi:hypothetical protein
LRAFTKERVISHGGYLIADILFQRRGFHILARVVLLLPSRPAPAMGSSAFAAVVVALLAGRATGQLVGSIVTRSLLVSRGRRHEWARAGGTRVRAPPGSGVREG